MRILELVRAQPAHKLPLVFTMESNPLPDCDESPEEVLEEVMRLGKDNLVEAFVVRTVTGKPLRVEVRYVTLIGRVAMDGRESKLKEAGLFGKVILLGLVLIFVLGLLLFFLRPSTGGFSLGKSLGAKTNDPKELTESPVKPTPEPTPLQPPQSQDANASQAESVHGE